MKKIQKNNASRGISVKAVDTLVQKHLLLSTFIVQCTPCTRVR